MRFFEIIQRLADLIKALMAGAVLVLAAVGIGVAVDALVVGLEPPVPGTPVVHLRNYVLPLGGLAALAAAIFGRAFPEGRAAARALANRETSAAGHRHAFRAVCWTLAGVIAFAAASWAQKILLGFFPPG